MKLRTLAPLACALGVGVSGGLSAKEAVKLPKPANTAKSEPAEASSAADNQRLAEAVAARLTSTSIADGADVSLVTDSGAVTVTGTAGTAAQKTAILQEIRVVAGVKLVRDGLTVGGVQQAQAAGPVSGMPPAGVMPNGPGMMMEPQAMGVGPGMGGMADGAGAAPPLPSNAWPTYAPYNNVSRVGYPTAYPYNAFPYIGPFYPFPKVPLGWRSVNLRWEDGNWYYGRTATPYDYWRVRFW